VDQLTESKAGGRTRIIVIDDEEPIRRALARYLTEQGFEVAAAESGAAALELFGRCAFDLAVCDVRMPGMSGLELMRLATERDSDLAVIMLTGTNHAVTATAALTGGAVDYLVKPVEFAELRDAIRRALHVRSLRIQQREVERRIREEVAQRTAELEAEKATLRQMSVGIVEALVNAMEAKDEYLRGHSQRVAALAPAIGAELCLPDEVIEQIRLAGRLHDIGRIGVRESVLNKAGTLTDE
jgi:response regulator RpfG family c-di-GMP phosphodiesterase